jgi:hypothetical protein
MWLIVVRLLNLLPSAVRCPGGRTMGKAAQLIATKQSRCADTNRDLRAGGHARRGRPIRLATRNCRLPCGADRDTNALRLLRPASGGNVIDAGLGAGRNRPDLGREAGEAREYPPVNRDDLISGFEAGLCAWRCRSHLFHAQDVERHSVIGDLLRPFYCIPRAPRLCGSPAASCCERSR